MLEILGEIDRGHPSAAQLVLDRVTVSQGGLQTGEKIGHVAAQKPSDNIIGAGTKRSQRAPVAAGGQIGRAAGRGRGEISVGGGSFKKKKKKIKQEKVWLR